MDEGRRQPAKSGRTERPNDARVSGPPTRPLNTQDVDALVPAADAIVKSAYGRTGALPVRPLIDRGDTDALVIQKAAKEARVLNFSVDGVHWRAGFALEVSQTPVGRHLSKDSLPTEAEKSPTGFQIRPAPTTQEKVLRDIIPSMLLQEEERMFGRGREILGFYLYYIPHGTTAVAGACAFYRETPTGKAHSLYLQTEVKRADPRILDEMAKTFAASAVIVEERGEPRKNFNFWNELHDARSEVRATLKESSISRNADVVKQRVHHARNAAENRVYYALSDGLEMIANLVKVVFTEWPLRLLAGVLRVGSHLIIRAIRGVDRGLEKAKGNEIPPPDTP
ncbi:MAG: hypothetical protein VKN33_09010 [Candidatus Sericytochromatia bacterium]|nr:hypothetical protein [Candidatus Sericytochromatia bacterium]